MSSKLEQTLPSFGVICFPPRFHLGPWTLESIAMAKRPEEHSRQDFTGTPCCSTREKKQVTDALTHGSVP